MVSHNCNNFQIFKSVKFQTLKDRQNHNSTTKYYFSPPFLKVGFTFRQKIPEHLFFTRITHGLVAPFMQPDHDVVVARFNLACIIGDLAQFMNSSILTVMFT